MMSGGDTTLNLRRLNNRRPSKPTGPALSMLAALLIEGTLTFFAPSVTALTSDSKQPMLIESDDMIYDEGKGETVYTGNVKATQGSLEVTGEKMIINQQKGESDQMIMFGKPARLKQTPDGGGPDNHGLGDRADYFPDSGILILNGNAMTWEGSAPETSEHTVKSDHIEYDTKNSIYKAGTPKTAKHRVHVRVLPKESKEPKE